MNACALLRCLAAAGDGQAVASSGAASAAAYSSKQFTPLMFITTLFMLLLPVADDDRQTAVRRTLPHPLFPTLCCSHTGLFSHWSFPCCQELMIDKKRLGAATTADGQSAASAAAEGAPGVEQTEREPAEAAPLGPSKGLVEVRWLGQSEGVCCLGQWAVSGCNDSCSPGAQLGGLMRCTGQGQLARMWRLPPPCFCLLFITFSLSPGAAVAPGPFESARRYL